ncbi:MAG TPA: cell division protein FtsA [Verrucomicrobiae bacterium]|nr:cell division protein FtsA [Verrucomicrobiae bacterium]
MQLSGEIFALDIGTRSVVGMVGISRPEGFEVLDTEIVEHSTRAMLDGQIHDIEAVAKVVGVVKARLEERLNHTLSDVAVAAAGRALRTFRGTSAMETFSLEEITRQQVLELELAAVQHAQGCLAEDIESQYYQCVGYSVVGYQLDGSPISNLLGHRGSLIQCEAIATFLPRSVVDSLYSVLKHCGLSMKTLTLEPIAALNVAIQPSMRTLNLSLVDIGAGTSDIALVSAGRIQNYAMVPMAGDEITEHLCNEFLLDFNTGEALKRSLHTPGPKDFQDVLGVSHCLDAAQILQAIIPGVRTLAQAIADKILELNTKPPSAVVLIGGGSLTPQFPALLAESLDLPEQRVALRGREVIPNLFGDLSKLNGPECITPIGIGITSVNEQALNLMHVEVNKRPVRLFSLNKGTVADALLAAGFNLRKLHGKPGMALSVTVNGELLIFKGELGVSATIRCNGKPVDLDTLLEPEACLEVIPARDGAPGRGMVRDAIPDFQEFNIRINGSDIKVTPRISLNDSLVSPDTALVDRAEITWQPINTVAELLAYLEVDPPTNHELTITVNKQKRILAYTLGSLLVNGQTASINAPVKPGDNLELVDDMVPRWKVRDVVPPSGPVFIDILLNGQARSLPGERGFLKNNGKTVYGDELLQDGDQLEYVQSQQQIIFSDLFKYLDFKPSPPEGKSRLVMEVNGAPAEFTTIITTGDSITLEWV